MSKGRISPISPRKTHSRKSKKRLAVKAEMLKRLASKTNRVHPRQRR